MRSTAYGENAKTNAPNIEAQNVQPSRPSSANIAIAVANSPTNRNVFQAPTSPTASRENQTNAAWSPLLATTVAGVRANPSGAPFSASWVKSNGVRCWACAAQ